MNRCSCLGFGLLPSNVGQGGNINVAGMEEEGTSFQERGGSITGPEIVMKYVVLCRCGMCLMKRVIL